MARRADGSIQISEKVGSERLVRTKRKDEKCRNAVLRSASDEKRRRMTHEAHIQKPKDGTLVGRPVPRDFRLKGDLAKAQKRDWGAIEDLKKEVKKK